MVVTGGRAEEVSSYVLSLEELRTVPVVYSSVCSSLYQVVSIYNSMQ